MTKLTISDIEKWMSYYYQNPQPELTPQVIEDLSKEGKLSSESAIVQIMYFFCSVFRENPDKMTKWTSSFMTTLSLMEKEILVTAIWLSNTETSKKYLNTLMKEVSELKEYINELLVKPFLAIENIPIDNPEILDALWASFMATGNEKYILRIISVLDYSHNPNNGIKRLIGNAAQWSIKSNMEDHPKLRVICTEQLVHQRAETVTILKNILMV